MHDDAGEVQATLVLTGEETVDDVRRMVEEELVQARGSTASEGDRLIDALGRIPAPALAGVADTLAGALRLPGDETGDCHLFTTQLAALAARQGVEFRQDSTVQALEADGGRITGVRIDGKLETADRYVLATGSWTPRLLAPLGIRAPIYPLKGYSITVPIIDADKAPVSTMLDETYKVAITRFDNRIRVGGMAEIRGTFILVALAGSLPPRCRSA